jgi:hypothetical protein
MARCISTLRLVSVLKRTFRRDLSYLHKNFRRTALVLLHLLHPNKRTFFRNLHSRTVITEDATTVPVGRDMIWQSQRVEFHFEVDIIIELVKMGYFNLLMNMILERMSSIIHLQIGSLVASILLCSSLDSLFCFLKLRLS